MRSGNRARILNLGAGFAGVETARRLARFFPREPDAEITLVDQNSFLLFTPMLIEVLGGQVEMLHIMSPARRLSKRITFLQGRVGSIDLAARQVTITIGGTGLGDPPTERVLEANHLVIALGSIPNFYGIPGLQQNCLTMKSVCDAVEIRNRALALLERANAEPDPEERRRLLTFVVGGGGFSGVETAAALHDLVHNASAYYPNIEAGDHKIMLIEALGQLLPELTSDLAEYALRKLQDYGTEVMLNTKIVEAGPDYVQLDQGRRIRTGTVIWTGGVSPVSIVSKPACKWGRHGGIITEPTCRVLDYEGVWAIGDCAEIPQPGSDAPYAPTAQNAVREGRHTARNIHASLCGKPLKPFVYRPFGELVALGKRSGVASIRGIHLSGFPAWFMWRTVYLAKLPRLVQRIRVGIDWTLDLVFGREIVEMPSECVVAGIFDLATGQTPRHSERSEESDRDSSLRSE